LRALVYLIIVTRRRTQAPYFHGSINNRVMNRKVTKPLSCMTLTQRLAEVSDFVFRFVATNSLVREGCLRARTACADHFSLDFRHVPEMEIATLRLVSRVLG
jgi:hypothetical protein